MSEMENSVLENMEKKSIFLSRPRAVRDDVTGARRRLSVAGELSVVGAADLIRERFGRKMLEQRGKEKGKATESGLTEEHVLPRNASLRFDDVKRRLPWLLPVVQRLVQTHANRLDFFGHFKSSFSVSLSLRINNFDALSV